MQITDLRTVLVRILRERLAPSGGRSPIPDRPGLGLLLDEAAIERVAVR